MKCLSPIRLHSYDPLTQKGTKFKRIYRTWLISESHNPENFLGVFVPCGQCIACRLNYAKFWSIRMMQEMKKHDCACFATLTYDDDHVPIAPVDCEFEDNRVNYTLVKRDIQLFWKRLRKERKVRYFCCGEYGDRFGRPHYHAIIYGVSPQETDLILKYWDKGQIKLGTCTEDSCNYVAKYMTKKIKGKEAVEKWKEDHPGQIQEFVLMSRRPGIGGDLDDDMINFMQETGFVYRKGFRSGIPRYYKEKFGIYSDDDIVQDEDDLNFRLTNKEKFDRLIRKGLEFYKKC